MQCLYNKWSWYLEKITFLKTNFFCDFHSGRFSNNFRRWKAEDHDNLSVKLSFNTFFVERSFFTNNFTQTVYSRHTLSDTFFDMPKVINFPLVRHFLSENENFQNSNHYFSWNMEDIQFFFQKVIKLINTLHLHLK